MWHVVGIRCKDEIVMGVEKVIASKMMLPGSNRRIHAVTHHSGMVVDGLAADGRQIVAGAKSEATNYQSVYGEPIPVKELADRVASYVHLCTLYWWIRPFGSGDILGGYDRDGPQLYMYEPSGVSHEMISIPYYHSSSDIEVNCNGVQVRAAIEDSPNNKILLAQKKGSQLCELYIEVRESVNPLHVADGIFYESIRHHHLITIPNGIARIMVEKPLVHNASLPMPEEDYRKGMNVYLEEIETSLRCRVTSRHYYNHPSMAPVVGASGTDISGPQSTGT